MNKVFLSRLPASKQAGFLHLAGKNPACSEAGKSAKN